VSEGAVSVDVCRLLDEHLANPMTAHWDRASELFRQLV
jgi:hypothetical protein